MPQYNSSSLYDEGPDMQSKEGMHDESKEHEDNSPSAVLPKSILMGKDFKVGEEIVLKITRIGEDDISVEYAEEKPKEEGAEEGGAEAPAPAMSGGNPGNEGMYG